ncbi:MAG: PQQ-binding-like beta-propeller repeat protein, partial [Actinomycetota bacterium]
VCRGVDSDGLAAVDPVTGIDRWSTDLPCGPLVAHAETATVIGADPDVDGGNRLLVVDTATGSVLVDRPIDDGLDDRVTGFERPVGLGETTVVGGFQADLVTISADGSEVARHDVAFGRILGVVDSLVVIADERVLRGVEPLSGAVVWEREFPAFPPIVVDGGGLWLVDGPAATAARLDPATGSNLWTADVGLTRGFDVAAADGVAYVVTTQALIALDVGTGDVLWSRHRPRPL